MVTSSFTPKSPASQFGRGFERTGIFLPKHSNPKNEFSDSRGNAKTGQNTLLNNYLMTNANPEEKAVEFCDKIKFTHNRGYKNQLSERFLACGHKAMLELELIELLLFAVVPKMIVKPLARRLITTFGDLNGIVAASEHRLLQVEGCTREVYLQLRIAAAIAQRMGQAKILKRNIISCWDDMIEYCRVSMAHLETEQFRVFYLDRKNVLIADEEQASGTVNHVPVYPREVAKRALEFNASAIILVHNHPSGDPTPSTEDVLMTQLIETACRAIDVIVHDHVIVGKGKEISFRTEGYFDSANDSLSLPI